jgi:hypothetical protein
MTVVEYFACLDRIRACATMQSLDALADEVRVTYQGDPQLGDVLGSIRMAMSGLQIAARQQAFVLAEQEVAATEDAQEGQ